MTSPSGLPRWARPAHPDPAPRQAALPGLADLLVWGVQRGWQLLGRPVNIHLTENGLGFTHPVRYGEAARIFVNPVVLERPEGEQLLQGLILHEIGHHAYHFVDKAFPQVDLELRRERLATLLNIVLDEHLERRLRAADPEWGEALDALVAYAFKGRPVRLVIEQYADLMGFPDLESAAEALLAGDTPGRVLECEWGYRLDGDGGRWVTGAELIDLLGEEMRSRLPGGRLPEDLAAKLRRIRTWAESASTRRMPAATLNVLDQNELFRADYGGEQIARISLTAILEPQGSETTDQRAYLERLKRELDPFLSSFPQLDRYLDELEAVEGSRWFWNKQRAMLFMMRRNRDFRDAFLPARTMGARKLRKLFGKDAFDPAAVLRDLLRRLRPEAEQNPRRPLTVELPWRAALDRDGVRPLMRFLISLRLGLGAHGAGSDEAVRAALAAVPKGLRKLEMVGLETVTREVARALGPSAFDRPPRTGEHGDDTGEAAEAGAGRDPRSPRDDWLRRALEAAGEELGRPLGGDAEEKAARGLKPAVDEAARRIDEWLRTGRDPARPEQEPRTGIRRGRPVAGRTIITRPLPPGVSAPSAGDRILQDLLNLAESLEFSPILQNVLPPARPAEYARIARPVLRHARALRRFLEVVGIREEEDPGQRRGRRLDPGRLRRLAALNETGVLIGLESRPAPDLFLGVCIDCSGSMAGEDRMDKAQGFGALLLEACRGLPGVAAHAVGFTDEVIFEIGAPGSTRLAGLEPQGGNNDAAGLLALARHALLSGKRKRLLVMISDGYPTECSLEALANLVVHLRARYGIASLQVAVDEMDAERVAFPRFTDLTRHELPVAVRLFGRLLREELLREYGAAAPPSRTFSS